MRELVAGLGPRTAAAISALLPGPVTLIVANHGHRYPLACREDVDRLGIRLISGPLAGAMCPVFQTSANLSGRFAPASVDQVPPEIVEGVDLVIDDGTLPGIPSTVVDISSIEEDGGWEVVRPGALSPGDLASSLASVGLG
jgi:L-threonylcarbamoyladenylate synthase